MTSSPDVARIRSSPGVPTRVGRRRSTSSPCNSQRAHEGPGRRPRGVRRRMGGWRHESGQALTSSSPSSARTQTSESRANRPPAEHHKASPRAQVSSSPRSSPVLAPRVPLLRRPVINAIAGSEATSHALTRRLRGPPSLTAETSGHAAELSCPARCGSNNEVPACFDCNGTESALRSDCTLAQCAWSWATAEAVFLPGYQPRGYVSVVRSARWTEQPSRGAGT